MVRYLEGAPSSDWAVRHRPPPLRRRPPPSRGRLDESPPVAPGRHNLTQLVNPPQLQLVCPQIIDTASGYPKDDPSCTLPRVVVGQGAEAEHLRNLYRLLSGDIVNATLDVAADGTIALSQLQSIKKGSQKCPVSAETDGDRLVLYLLDFSSCPGAGMAPPAALTPEAAKSLLVAHNASGATSNLQAYQETCSYRRRPLYSSNVVVVGPVPVPCTGALSHHRPRTDLVGLSGAAANALRMNSTHTGWWDLSRTCTPAEMGAIERAAEAFAQQVNVRLGRHPGFVDASTLLPPVSAAAAAPPRPPHVLMHELLHVQGLSHAAYGALEAGDPTDVMGTFGGAGTGLLCPNAPNMYLIGWAKPINPPGTPPFRIEITGAWGNLTANNFTTTNWLRDLVIPAQGTRDDNMIVVNVGVKENSPGAKKAAGAQSYFFSYRIKNNTANGYDSGLTSDFHKKVLVHNYNGIQSARVLGFKSNLLDWGPNFQRTGNAWISPFLALDADGLGGGVRLEVKSTTNTQAVVDICRITENGKEQWCSDGLDNDCDGLFDAEDPDCA
ncbi:hypothetical protein HYH02_005398 [Chlamydomonas schloesseri]|uniref:Peptidase M11 gametolysin domain-containing protein n=1 Tax=Chlamydomonas schloesseri TaxID=2026947 RepID=A0A835WLZ0_9CHLO|nr:hypothetical protein HYH02_005398 [Chlamydomonas schloesseri]|eukprot:KAG2449876.1 hypothetical protein HYH02_005398 [Chlamydomonas schloesseri]